MGSLDRPAMPAQVVAAFDAFAGNACRHASQSQVTTAPRVIVALVGVELAGPLSWSAIQSRYRRDGVYRAFERHLY